MSCSLIKKTGIYFSLLLFMLISTACGLISTKKTDSRKTPTNALERAKQNVKEGKGMAIGNILKRGGSSNYEFSTSNPMWRAALETIDFIPLSTVDYSGGLIITDWYSDSNSNESLKITIRFLSNEIQSNSLKIIVHQKKCLAQNNCNTRTIDSKIKEELIRSILVTAATLEKNKKVKK